ncbi:Cupin domain-containing protein [Monaibacterium marinum]|uniref:Cupin domain-containing protein n=1 Tax=Pontivivens marinum TaxID=1690039 RepID=A0A2C9CV80_9RHOB|nr:helix-turn-helix domain-containing protein [Monaibacterium marinum]SOH95168.1 Cupin domain-containing protein [Monaibacterium marinum]
MPYEPSPASTLGADLRALRRTRGLTLGTVAQKMDRSIGWISQVERDLSTPTHDDLRAFADTYEVPLSLFFGESDAPDNERGLVVRAGSRRAIGDSETGLREQLVSPDLTDSFEVIRSVFAPGARMDTPKTRETQEVAYILSGSLTIWLDDVEFIISAGDSFRVRGQSLRWHNPNDLPAIAVWVISPPVY